MPSIEELKARISGLNRGGGNKKNDIWKPTDEHVVRLLEYPHGRDPFIELFFHYEVGDETIVCPKMNGEGECAICDFADTLKSWKDDRGQDKAEADRKADWEIFKKIQAKARIFIPMIERGKESLGPKFWGVSPTQATEILSTAMDGDRMEECGISKDEQDASTLLKILISPTKAYDLNVSFAKPGAKGNTKTFGTTTIKAKIKACALADEKTTKDILASIKRIADVYPVTPSGEVQRLLDRWTGNATTTAKPEGGNEKYSGKTEEKKTDKKVSNENAAKVGTRSIDDALADLTNESKKEKK